MYVDLDKVILDNVFLNDYNYYDIKYCKIMLIYGCKYWTWVGEDFEKEWWWKNFRNIYYEKYKYSINDWIIKEILE